MEEKNREDFLKDLPVTAEEIGFKPGEMVSCGNCSRFNPPNRLKCVYCGAGLELSEEQTAKIAPVLRKLEDWENGFNLIYLPQNATVDAEKTAQIAQSGGLDKEFLQNIFDSHKSLPLVRAETIKEAELLQNRLRDAGLETLIVADEKLDAENPPKRLRGLEFEDDKILFILFNNDEVETAHAADLSLIVAGAVFQKTVESTEARKKGETKILDATETASDEILIDIYARENAHGWRVLTKGFDFSCLGAEKGILARENIKKLTAKLQTVAQGAKFIDDYLTVRNVLGEVWEIEQRKDSKGLTRQRFGKFDLSNVASSNNERQFTKYSRLQWHLL